MLFTPADHGRGGRIGALVAAGVLTLAVPAQAEPAVDGSRHDAHRTVEQLERGLAYEHGEGLPKDQRVAAAMYCDAARAGSAEGAYRLGWMYANGRGVAHDDATAVALFRLAADNGHVYGANMMMRLGGAPGLLPDCMRPPEPAVAVVDDDQSHVVDAGPDPFENLPPYKQKIADVVNRFAPRYGIEPRLALAVIAVESNFDAMARSVKDARGLMQLIPQTLARFNVRNPYDIADNVRGGLAYLRWLLAYYRGQVTLAAAAYNAGEGAVDYYRGIPPYPETREYVRRILRLFRSDRHPYDPRVVEASAIVGQLSAGAR
jgi:hypothetical protein